MRPQHLSPTTVALRKETVVSRVRRAGLSLAATATLLGSLAVGTGAAGAEPNAGDLDTTFNGTGTADTAVFNNIAADDVTRTPDGKLLVLVSRHVWRFDSAGRVDLGFGGDGAVEVRTEPRLLALKLASLPDGRFVVVGRVGLPGGGFTFGAARLLADGTLDPTFGTDLDGDGSADQIPVFPADSFVTAFSQDDVSVVVQSTGHVVVVGEAVRPTPPRLPAAGRISPDGTVVDVRVITSPLGTSTNVSPVDAALGPADSVAIAAFTSPDQGIAAINLEADLVPNPAFDGDGFVVEQDDEFSGIDLRVATLPNGTVGVMVPQASSNGVFLFRWSRSGRFLGRSDATFDDRVDQTLVTALVAAGPDSFLAGVAPLDSDPGTRTRSVAAIHFDADGLEEDRSIIERTGFQLDAGAGVSDGNGGLVVAGGSIGPDGDRPLLLAGFTADAQPNAGVGAGGLALIAGGNNDVGEAVAVTSDGGVIVGGEFAQDEGGRGGFLIRHREDGRLDEDFGGPDTTVPGIAFSNEAVHGVAVDERGRILSVGEGFDGDGGEFGVVERREADGAPDLDFGNGVPVRIPAPADGIRLNAVAVDADGRIVVVGTVDDFQASLGRFFSVVVVRLLDDGTPDVAFNRGAPVVLPVETEAGEGRAVAVQPDGKIVVVGSFNETPLADPCCGNILVARLNDDGTLDDSFGDRAEDPGLRFERIGDGMNRGTGVALGPDGRIVVAGFAADIVGANPPVADPAFAVAIQLLPDGRRDPAFGDDGLFTSEGSVSAVVGGVTVDEDGNRIVAGSGGATGDPGPPAPPPEADDVVLIRLTPDGVPDDGFGEEGVVWTDLGGIELAASVAIDPDGRIVVGGSIADDRGTRALAARYHPVTLVEAEPEPEPEPPPPAAPVFTPTVSLNPAVGRAGQATIATGAGFPPGATVNFDWSQGIDTVTPVTVGDDGTFRVSVLVLPSEILGSRLLNATTTDPATGTTLAATTPYLVSIGTTQPGDFVGRR